MKLKTIFLLSLLFSQMVYAAKVKEIANIIGVRDNQLIGYGLVVGLKGTGDGSSAKFTLRALSNLLQTVNVKIDPKDIKSKNIAAVIVTTKLPPFSRQGDNLDVVISSIGDAKSLQGGTLLMTPLKAVDGQIYALAQGPLTIGGIGSKGGSANHSTAGTIFGGALVERETSYDLHNRKFANLSLKRSDFTTAIAIEKKINQLFSPGTAVAVDPRTVKLKKPTNISMVEFLARISESDVNYQKENKIVIDERTGTIVAGIAIKVEPVVVTHGDLTIKISPREAITPDGKNDIDLKDGISVEVNNNILNAEYDQITVANIARALQKLGAKPKDIISIIETMKRAGAITADLEII